MPGQKLKAKNISLPESLAEDAKDWAAGIVQRLFGLSQGWEKHRDIVQNNYDLGLKHLRLSHVSDAIFRFKLVTWLAPKRADGWYQLGCSYLAGSKPELAQKALRQSLEIQPVYEEAAYMLAIASGKSMPPEQLPKTMPLPLVRDYFERLAPGYAKEQIDLYHYQGHTLLCQAIRAALTPGRIDHVMLDLGVGTGLCGPLLRDVAAQLTGIDISLAMLAEAMKLQDAEGRKIYDALIARDMQEFLRDAAAAMYDIVMASGSLSYIGDLGAIYQQAARVVKPGGIFAFTIDKMDGQEFRLDTAAGRFRYAKAYLEKLAAANGLKAVKCEEVPMYPNYDAWLCVFAK